MALDVIGFANLFQSTIRLGATIIKNFWDTEYKIRAHQDDVLLRTRELDLEEDRIHIERQGSHLSALIHSNDLAATNVKLAIEVERIRLERKGLEVKEIENQIRAFEAHIQEKTLALSKERMDQDAYNKNKDRELQIQLAQEKRKNIYIKSNLLVHEVFAEHFTVPNWRLNISPEEYVGSFMRLDINNQNVMVDENKRIPLTVFVAYSQKLENIAKELEHALLDFASEQYANRTSVRPVKILQGAWRTGSEPGIAMFQALGAWLNAVPTLIISLTDLSGRLIIQGTYWGFGTRQGEVISEKIGEIHNSIEGSIDVNRDLRDQSLSLVLAAVSMIADLFHLQLYDVEPNFFNALPQFASENDEYAERCIDGISRLYNEIVENEIVYRRAWAPDLYLILAKSHSKQIDKSRSWRNFICSVVYAIEMVVDEHPEKFDFSLSEFYRLRELAKLSGKLSVHAPEYHFLLKASEILLVEYRPDLILAYKLICEECGVSGFFNDLLRPDSAKFLQSKENADPRTVKESVQDIGPNPIDLL